MKTQNRTKITLLAVLIVSTLLSGCVETREYDWKEPEQESHQMYMTIEEFSYYATENAINAEFDSVKVILNPDKSGEINGTSITWVHTGTRNDAWSCAIVGSDDVDYIYFFMDEIAVITCDDKKIYGTWTK